MASRKEERQEVVSIERDVVTYTGSCTIMGTKKLTQTIWYNGRSKYDGHGYRPSEGAYRAQIAKIMLRELVDEGPSR